MLSKKDYIKIAEILKNNAIIDGGFKKSLLSDFIEFLKIDNPNFDEMRFLKAIN